MKWRHKEAPYDWGYLHEGLWAAPFEMDAQTAAREAAVWASNGFMTTWGEENYPAHAEVTIFTMDCGKAVEVASLTVVRKRCEGGFYELPDGTPIPREQAWQGNALETREGWTEVRKY
jgi:hypothetical protein